MVKKLDLLIIFGGRSGEYEVSLMSARSVLSVLDPQRYTVTQIGITQSGKWLTGADVLSAFSNQRFDHLERAVLHPEPGNAGVFVERNSQLTRLSGVDVVFPVLHGSFGEDGALQGFLELADVAYVGAGVLGSAVGMDKSLFKDVMRANGLPVVDSRTFSRQQLQAGIEALMNEAEQLGYPLFVKPANLGSSVGITKCRSRADLYEGLLEAARFDRRILVEKGVPAARELEVSVLGNADPIASLPGEVHPADDFYTYNAKYYDENSKLTIPADIPLEKTEQIRDLAVRAYRAIDCAGLGRIDFLMDGNSGEIFVGEVNTIPGFTAISMYPKLWDASGIGYRELIDRLIQLALDRKAERDATERQFRRDA